MHILNSLRICLLNVFHLKLLPTLIHISFVEVWVGISSNSFRVALVLGYYMKRTVSLSFINTKPH